MKVRGYNVGKRVLVRLSREDIRKAKRAKKNGQDRCRTCPVTQAVSKTLKRNDLSTGHGLIYGKDSWHSIYVTSRDTIRNIIVRFDTDKEVKPCVFAIYPVLRS